MRLAALTPKLLTRFTGPSVVVRRAGHLAILAILAILATSRTPPKVVPAQPEVVSIAARRETRRLMGPMLRARMPEILQVNAREILDSRGNPTVEAEVQTDS